MPRPLLVLLVTLCLTMPCAAEDIRFPADAGVVDVTQPPYSAAGDGRTDDTAAIQQALEDHPSGNRIIYLPNGTYLVSNTLRWPEGRPGGGDDCKRVILQGQSRDGTVIRLKDNCPGFERPLPDPRYKRPMGKGVLWTGKAPAQRFRNAVRNLTIDTGSGNAGACGMQFVANNSGCVRHVLIRSGDGRGVNGLDLGYTNEQGPCLIQDVEVRGFDHGIYSWSHVDSVSLSDIRVSGQRVAGVLNVNQVFSIERLRSVNTCPALVNDKGDGVVTLLGAECLTPDGKTAEGAAIVNRGVLYARDVATRGYERAIANHAGIETAPDGPAVAEFSSHTVLRLYDDAPPRGLALPVRRTPEIPWDDLDDWISPLAFGGRPDDKTDDTAAIQQAIDAGKTTVYLPAGTWFIQGELLLRGRVRRLIGCEAALKGKGTVRVVDGESPVVAIERIEFQYAPIGIRHESKRTLVISSCRLDRNEVDCYEGVGGGDLFLEDVCGDPWVFRDQNVWARQLNPESKKDNKITATNSRVWILGLKTESDAPAVVATGGAVEVCGAFIYANTGSVKSPLFILRDAAFSATMGEYVIRKQPFRTLVVETWGDRTRTLEHGAAPKRSGGSKWSLYAGLRRGLATSVDK